MDYGSNNQINQVIKSKNSKPVSASCLIPGTYCEFIMNQKHIKIFTKQINKLIIFMFSSVASCRFTASPPCPHRINIINHQSRQANNNKNIITSSSSIVLALIITVKLSPRPTSSSSLLNSRLRHMIRHVRCHCFSLSAVVNVVVKLIIRPHVLSTVLTVLACTCTLLKPDASGAVRPNRLTLLTLSQIGSVMSVMESNSQQNRINKSTTN